MLINLDDLDKKGIKPTIKDNQQSLGKFLPSKSSVMIAIEMRTCLLADDKDYEDAEVKSLVNSGADLVEIDDSEADEKDALNDSFSFYL